MAKKGLGKGLGALLASSMADEDAGAVREIPIGQIRPNPYQPRKPIDPASVADLAKSVREHGVLQPLIVKRVAVDTYELVAGERRLRAAEEAGLASVPVVVREYDSQQMLEVALIENLQREDIGPVEAAVAYKRLSTEFGLTQTQIARRVGKAQSTIANSLRILTLPAPIVESVGKGEITEGHARALLQAAPKARLDAWEKIRSDGLSVRQAEELTRPTPPASQPSIEPDSAPADKRAPATAARSAVETDPHISAVEDQLRSALGTKVTLRWNGESGRIDIEVYSPEHLDAVVERLTGAMA